MAIRVEWDEHEQAILLCALIKVLNHELDRKQTIKTISKQLRELAKDNGIVIDDKFRNENGIALQMSKLEYVYTKGASGLYVDAGWYFSIVRIYRNNYKKYMELLGETMEASKSDKAENMSFASWLEVSYPKQVKRIISSLKVLSMLLLKSKVIRSNILKIKDVEEIASIIEKIRTNRGINIYIGGKRTAYITALSAYKDYLQYLQNEQNEDNECTETEGSGDVDEESVNEGKTDELKVSFTESRNYSYTRPSDLEYFGRHYSIRNWTQAYVQTLKCLFEDYPDRISSMQGKCIRGKGRIDIADTVGSDAMLAPCEIADDLFLETNESAADIIKKIGLFLNLCDVDYDEVKILYSFSRGNRRQVNTVQIKSNGSESGGHNADGLSFYDWLTKTCGMAEGTGRSYDSAINTIDKYAQEHNIGNGTLRGTTDVAVVSKTADDLFQTAEFMELNQSQHNRFRAALRRYVEYLSGGGSMAIGDRTAKVEETFEGVDFAPYRKLLIEKFPKGFRIDSGLSMGRFRSFWETMYKTELTESNEDIRKRINYITIRCNDFVYLPEMMMSEQTAERIFSYIAECFQDGKMAVYFDALYKEFENEFEGKRINNPEMLKSYLAFANNGRFYIHKNYLTKDAHAKVDSTDEVRNYMMTIGVPVTVDDLKAALSHINADAVYRAVAGSHSAEFVRNQKGEYFHADIIQFTQQEIDTITEMIQRAIDDKGYMGGKELTDAIEVKLPTVMERYPFLEWLGLRDVIAYKLRDMFSFKRKIISPYGQNLSMTEVFAHFASTRDYFTLEQLNSLKRDLDTPIYFDSVYANSLRINADEFVSRDQAAFDIEATDAAISRFCTGDYIALREISFFGSFPNAGFPWNVFLLEHYIAEFSKDFKLLHSGFTAGKPVGAIVRRSSRYNDFDELLSAELAVSGIPLDRENALQYLVDNGLLARKNYGKIEQVLSTAKQQRLTKG